MNSRSVNNCYWFVNAIVRATFSEALFLVIYQSISIYQYVFTNLGELINVQL